MFGPATPMETIIMADTPRSSAACCAPDPLCNPSRRQLLMATAGVGGALVVAAAAPFVASLAPSGRAPAAGAPAAFFMP